MKPRIICLTPVKNESWILAKFLSAASLWADHIIIADQNSDDGSVEIAKEFDKVRLIRNNSPDFNEPERQKMLIEAAREIPGRRLLVALDADEFLTPNFLDGPEWDAALEAPAGSVFSFQRAELMPDLKSYWTEEGFLFGFMDDGESRHEGSVIHSTRLPIPQNTTIIGMNDIEVMHFQYTDWERMKSKHRWYQCWERLNFSERSPIDIYRIYNHMYAVGTERRTTIPDWWFGRYLELGIDLKAVNKDKAYWWDGEVLNFLHRYGTEVFRKEAIWDTDWREKAVSSGFTGHESFNDPRSFFEKAVHTWLKKSQLISNRFPVRMIDWLLKRLFKW